MSYFGGGGGGFGGGFQQGASAFGQKPQQVIEQESPRTRFPRSNNLITVTLKYIAFYYQQSTVGTPNAGGFGMPGGTQFGGSAFGAKPATPTFGTPQQQQSGFTLGGQSNQQGG